MALRSQRLSELFRSMGYKEPTASVTNDEQPKEVAVGIGADADGNDTEETVISEGVTLPKVEQKTPDDVKENVQQTLPTDEDKKDDIQQVVDHYQRGYDVADAIEKQNIRNRMNNQRTNLTQFVNEDVMNRLDDDDDDDVMGEIETYGWSDDEKKQVRDYIDSRRAYNGMIAKVQDDIDAAVTANDDIINQRVSSLENGGDGMIHPATMAKDNRQVDIVSGNVVMTDDGTMIDHAKSDKDIIVRDRNTGKVEYVGINSLKSVEAPVDAEQLKASDAERISNEMAQAASKEIDGTLDFNAGDVYTLADDNGEVRDIQVLQDNGDGNVTVSIDGEQTVMPKDEMQQMADSTNMRRVTENEVQQPVDVAAQKGKKDGDMPMIDKDGEEEPDFMATTPQRGRKYLYEEAGLDNEEADKIAQNNRKEAEKELTELKDKKPEPSTDVAKYQREKEEYNRKVEEAQKKVDYWQTILDNTPMSSAGASIMRSQMTAMDKKFADYVKERQDYYNAHGTDDPNGTPVSRIIPDLLFSGQAETPEEALQKAKDLLWRSADISSREIAGNFVMSLPNDAANMGENINKAWYTESMQKEVERKAHELGLDYETYVKGAVIPAFRSEMQHRFHLSEQSARAWSSYIFSDYGAAVNEMRQQEANAIVRPYVQEFITDAFSQVDEEARKMWQGINDNNTTMYTPQGVPTTAGLNIYGLMKEQQITDPQRVWDELLEPRMDGIVASIVNNKNLMSSLIGQMEKEDMSPEDYITNRIYPVIESMVYSEWYKTGVSREMPTNFAEYLQKRLKDSLVGMLIDTMVNSKTRRAMAQEAMAQTEEGEGSYTPSTVTKITGEAASIMADAPLFGVAGKVTAPIARTTVNGLMGNYMERLIGRVAGASISSGYTIGGAEFIKGSLRGGIESDSDNIFGVVSDALGSGVESGIGGFKTGLAFFGRPIAQSIVNGTGAVRTALGLLSATVVNSIAATAAEAGEEYVTNGKVDVDKLPTSFAHNVMLFGVLEGRSLAKEVYHTARGERYINNVRFSQEEVAQLESIEGVKNLRDLSQKIEKERREGNVETYAETAQSQRRRTRRQRDLTEEERKALNEAGAQFYEAVMSDKETPLETKVKVAQALQLPLTMEATAPEERFDEIEERDGKFVLASRNMFGYKMAEQTFATREEAEQKRDEVEKQWMDEAKDGSSRMENIIAASNVYKNLADRMNEELNSGIVERAQRRKQLEAKANRAKKNKGIGMTRAERRELESLKPTNHERELLWIYEHNDAYEQIVKKARYDEELTEDERMLALEMRSHVEKVANDYVNKEIKSIRDEFGVDTNDVDSLRDYIDWGTEEIERIAKEERERNPEPVERKEEVRAEEQKPIEETEEKPVEEVVEEETIEPKEETVEERREDDTTPDYSKVTSDDGVIREVTLKDGRKGYFVIRKGERIGDKYKIVDLDGNEMGEYDTSDIADFRETSAVEEAKPVESPVEEIKQDTYEDLINNWRDEQESVNTEGGLIRDEVSERALPTSWAGALHRVGRDIGKRFVVLSKEDVEAKYGKGVDGYTIGDTIYLNEDFVRRGDSFRSLITGHELTHILKKASPELWDAYVKSVKDAMGDEYQEVFADKRKKYDEKYDELGLERLSDADIDEEIVCDFAGKNILTNADEARRIVESAESVGADPVKVVKQVLDWLKNTVDMLRQALSNGEDVNEQLAAYEQAQKLWQGMYQTAVAKRNAEKRAAEEKRKAMTDEGVSSLADAADKLDDGVQVAKFNLATEETLQKNIKEWVGSGKARKEGWSDEKVAEVVGETADLIRAIHNALSGDDFYKEWSVRKPTVKIDWRDGEEKPTVTWTRGNIEYKYDMSADLLCINNEGMEEVLSSPTMVELMMQMQKSSNYTSDDYLTLYETLRDLGFVVPCKGCFDAAARFKMLPSVSQKFVDLVNKTIDERNKDVEAFDNKLKEKAKKAGNAMPNGLPDAAGNKEEAVAIGVAGDNITEHITWTQLMSAKGQTQALYDWGGVFRAWQKTGAGRPKDKLLPEPYRGDIISPTSTIIASYGSKTPSYNKEDVNVGTGLRRNSHSEFRPLLAIDEIQFMRDAYLNNLMVFKYMKELDDVRLFGQLGVKFNMSFFPAFVKGAPAAGLDVNGDYIAAEESVGGREFEYKDENGKTHYDGMKGFEEAQKYINENVSLSSVVFSIPHLIKSFTDVPTRSDKRGIWGSLIPFHASGATAASLAMQGLGKVRALGVGHPFSEAFTDYDKGVTNFEDVQNDRFGEGWVVVSGKKAGNAVEAGHKIEFANGNHYYNKRLGLHLFSSFYIYDNEIPKSITNSKGKKVQILDKNGNIIDSTKVKGELKKIAHPFYIDYNDKVREIGTDYAYDEASAELVDTLRSLGLVPRFDFNVPEDVFLKMCEDANVDPKDPKLGWKGEGNGWSPVDSPSYYSLWCDYGMTDPATGKYAPHRPVGYIDENGERSFRMPDNTIDILREGVARYSTRKNTEEKRVNEAINEFAKRSVERGKISKEDADRIINGGKEAETRFRVGDDFYSPAERAVDSIKQEKATGEQWLKMIEKNGGLKKEEDKWMGLSDFLKDKKSLTKQEVLDFIRENQVKVEEVEYGNGGINALQEEYDELIKEHDGNWEDAWDEMIDRYGDDIDMAIDGTGGRIQVNDGFEDYLETINGTRGINSTRMNYTTKGLENKKEIALTVPTIESWNRGDEIHFGDAGEGRAVAWIRFGETTDADGNRVLVIDEIQSKRHQEGREYGYRGDVQKYIDEKKKLESLPNMSAEQYKRYRELAKIIRESDVRWARQEYDEFSERMKKEYGQGIMGNYENWSEVPESVREEIRQAKAKLKAAEDNASRIPDAPFQKNWHELAMKRMLRYAAENGYDKVAWTKGEQQAERYNLGGKVKEIDVDKEQGDLFITMQDGTLYDIGLKEDGTLSSDSPIFDGKNVVDVFGKDMGGRIMDVKGKKTFAGEELRIGGEGMKGFYDQMLPRFMDKYGKKWGVKTGEVELPNVEEAERKMWSVDVTPEMKESVMEGQPMFRIADDFTAEEAEEASIRFRVVDDPKEKERLEKGKKVKRYRAMAMIDGKLYPPMSVKVDGKLRQPTEVGVWEQADETPIEITEEQQAAMDALDAKKGKGYVDIVEGRVRYVKDSVGGKGTLKFKLKKDNGDDVWAAYNPYFHTSTSGMNDQFASAWKRPNLVVVEVEIPEEETTGVYTAPHAKDSTGDTDWKSGTVNEALPKDRQRTVTLSRYAKVLRVVPDAEVAEGIAKQLDGLDIAVPFNVVTPTLREELIKRGVKIGEPEKGNAGKASRAAYDEWKGGETRFSIGGKEVSKPNTSWWNDGNRLETLDPTDYRTYTTDEAKEYFANYRSEDGKVDFTKWSHPNLAYITAAAWDGVKIPVEELMQIPEIIEAERRIKEKDNLPKFKADKTERKKLRDRLLDAEHGSAVFEDGKIRKIKDSDGNKKEDFSGEVRQEKKAFVVVGKPAGGKSSVFANRLSFENGARIIDSDIVKPWLSGYDDGYGAGYVQPISASIATSALKKASDVGENIVLPRIGGDSVMDEVMMLREKGYDVQIFYNEVSSETSIMRAASRFAQEGRYLSLDYLTRIGDKDSRSFRKFVGKLIKEYYDTVNKQRPSDRIEPFEDVLGGRGSRPRDYRKVLRWGDNGGRGDKDVPRVVSGRRHTRYARGGQEGFERTPSKDELIFSHAEWKSNDVAFGEKPKEVWDSDSGIPLSQAFYANGFKLTAPNGKRTNLSVGQYDIVRSPIFKEYFGDWEKDPENASKAVDENGEPLVLHHGTNLTKKNNSQVFWVFSPDSHFGTKGQADERRGISKKSMDFRIGLELPLQKELTKDYAVYLNIRNPKRVSDVPQDEDVWDGTQQEWWARQIAKAKAQGYDGIVYRNEYEDVEHPADSWIAFYPDQIKSADPVTYDNNGKPIPLSERFNEENDDIRFRVSDERRRREYAERQWKRAHNKAANTIKSLGISDNVTVVDTPEELAGYDSMSEQQKASKGWYDENTGNIVVVVGNHTSPEDVQRTILREGVARYGLRQMFGQNYNNFLDNVLTNAETDIRKEIVNIATRNGYDFRKATEEYLARLANDTDFERAMKQSWWSQIKSYFLDMLHSIGLADWIEDDLSDNELRYMLWRSYMNLTEPDRYRNPFNVAREISMRNTLNIEDYIPEGELSFEEEKRLRERVSEMSLDEARAAYERINNKMLDDESLDIDEHTEKVRLGWLNEHGLEGLGKAMADDFNSLVDKYGMGMLALRWDLQDHIEKIENDGETRFRLDEDAEDTEESSEGGENGEGSNEPLDENYDAGRKSLADSTLDALTTLVEKNKQNVQLRKDALHHVGTMLMDLCKEMQERPYDNWDDSRKVSMGVRQAASKQRKFDKETVDGIVRLARTLIKSGLFKGFSPYEVNRLMSLVKNAAGRKDITKQAEKVVDILLNRQIKEMQSLLEKQMKVKGSKLNQRGVEVQGALDIHGQRVLDALKKGISRTEEELDNRINEVTERMNDENESIAKNAKAEWEGLMMAKAYQDGITKSKAEEVGLRQELKDAEEEMKAGRMSREAYNEFVKTTNDALRDNKLERIRAYENVIDNLTGGLRESVARAKEWKEQEQQRVQEIHHNANSDLEGIEPLEHKNIKIGWFENAVKNNPVSRILFAPAATFDTMLRYFGGKHVDGKGYLWKRFMPQFIKASDSEWRNKYAAHKTLDEKVSEVFGKKMRWSDLFSIVRKMPTVKVSFWDAGEMQEHDLTQGNLLYIYAVNKMSDGKMKLRKMGITEEDVAAIEAQLDPRLKELIDWAQNDFLVKKREDYNKVHERMFGAPMAAIENYFPLKIVGRALDKTVDIGETHGETDKPSTIVGSVIKRVRNSKPLDVLNTDAFDTVLEHIDEMEHWASFAEFCRDLNTLLSYKNFRNKVENMKSLRFGTGQVKGGRSDSILSTFKDTAAIAAGAYSPKRGRIDKEMVNIAKGVTAAKIALRIYTAFKQLTSYPAYFSEASVAELAKSSNPYGMYKSWKWAMENLPLYSKRWQSRQAGDQRLKETDVDWKVWKNNFVEKLGRVGMSANAAIDALTVAMGAKAIYETKKKRYLKDGYSAEKAHEKALVDASVAYNETQQSSEEAFLSAVQLDRSFSSVAMTVFRNASMGYQRRYLQALSNMKRRTKKGYKEESIEFMKKQAMRDGLTEEQAERVAQRTYNRGLYKDLANVAIFGYVLQLTWNLAPYAPYLVMGDDDDEKKAMWEDAFRHALFGGLEGTVGGNIYSDVGNMLLQKKDEFGEFIQDPSWGGLKDIGKDVANHNFTLMPLSSDLQGIIKHLGSDPVSAVDDAASLLIQSSIGTNPKTLTDAIVAIADYCNGDPQTSREAALLIMRILQVPQPTLDKLYIDELGMSGKEARQLSVEEMAQRYARYKMNKNAPVIGQLSSEEYDKKVEDRYVKLFSEKVAERIERMSDEELMENFNSTQPKDISGRKIMSKEIAKRMEGKDSYGTSKTDYGKVYLEHRDYTDIAEDVLLQNAVKEAKQDGNEERAKDIEDVRREITKLKKELTDVPFTLPDGTRVTADDIMNEIRQVRKDALKEFKITKSNK